MKNLDSIAKELFNKIRGRFPKLEIGDSNGTVINTPEDARYFDFGFDTDVGVIGKVSVSLDEENGITVIIGKDIIENQPQEIQNTWYNFLKELRVFSKKRLLNFDVRDINRSNLKKRDYKFLAASRPGDENMNESKMYGTNKTSFLNIGEARLRIKHSAPINADIPSGRTQHIESIYIESPDGERFKYPYKHLSGAKAMARHVSEGGKPYDEFGSHIVGLSEELANLKTFKRYMGRGGVMAESLSQYMGIVNERISDVKKTIDRLQKQNYYGEAILNFETTMLEEVPEDVVENWIDQLTIKQFNEELKDVFPYIYKLVGEATRPKVLGPEDLEEKSSPAGGPPCWDGKKIGDPKTKMKGGKRVNNCVPEEIELEQGFEEMMGQFADVPVEEGFKSKLAMLALLGLTGLGAMKMTDPTNSPLGQALQSAAEQGDEEAGMHLRRLGSYIDGDDTQTLRMLNYRYIEEPGAMKDSETPPVNIEQPKKPKTPLGEFILSYFDKETGKFPKGETAVLTAVEKDYGRQFVKPAAQFIKQVESTTLEYKTKEAMNSPYPQIELMKNLAGI